MKASTILAAASAALAAALPSGGRSFGNQPQPQPQQQLATFDNLPSVPAISELSPVGDYMGLTYKSFNVLQQGVAGIITTGVQPQSGLQVAANGITDSVLRGGPAFLPAKGTKSFDLESLYLACVVNSVESAAGVPQQCTIAFTAYKAGSSKPFQTVNKQFNPTNPVLSKMSRADFPSSWSGLQRVDIATVQATTTSTLSGLLIDNVAYKLNK